MADILPFPEWKPDLSPYKGVGSQNIKNVLPRADGYGPSKSFQALTGAFPAGNDSFTKVLLHFEGADAGTVITDDNAGGSAHTWTAAGNANTDTAQTKFGLTSLGLDGTGDFISTPDHADFTIGTSAFEVDMWVRFASTAGTQVMMRQGLGGSGTLAWTLEFASNVLNFALSPDGTASTSTTAAWTPSVDTWYHVKANRDSSNVGRIFVDGVLMGSGTNAVNVFDSGAALVVGALSSGAAPFNGWIDEVNFTIGTARNTSAFLPNGGPYDTEAAAICRGLFCARKTDGSVAIFAGTQRRLWLLNNTNLVWDEVSKTATAYTALPTGFHWQFAQFGSIVIAVKPSTAPQEYTLGSSTLFADLAGSPPQAAYIAIVGRFVVLSGLTSNPFRIHWSALGSAIGWTQGTGSSDFQDLPDGGIVLGVAGGELGVIFQESAMRRMVFAPGSPVVFTIERIAEDKGLLAPYSLVRAGERIFWLAAQGFHGMAPTGLPEAIGKERFDRFFFDNYDSANLQLIIGAADPQSTRVYWAFKSASGSGSVFDFILCYDYGIGRATLIEQSGEYLASLAAPGLTLENLDSISASIDALGQSLDDISTAAVSKLSMANTSHVVGFFSGSNIEATLDTSEQAGGRRFRVKGFRPITDATTVMGSIGARENVQSAVVYSAEQAVNSDGFVRANVSTRAARGRVRFPAASTWTFATGVEPEFTPEGRRQ